MNYEESLSKLAARTARKEARELKAKTLWVKGSKPPKKIPKAKLHKRLVKALDTEFSLMIRARWPVCFFPGCGKPTKDCFHFFTRAKRSIRWDERNAVGSCKGHNILYEQDQSFIDDVRIWFVARFGQVVWDTLKIQGNIIVKWEPEDLQIILDGIRSAAINTPCVNSDSGI